MIQYEYKCFSCGAIRHSEERESNIFAMCRSCDSWKQHKRVWGFNYRPGMEPHYNRAVGAPVSSMKQFKDKLKAKSEEMAQPQTFETLDGERVTIPGIETNYQPLEWGDHQAFGATNEGIEESNRIRAKNGDPLLPEIK